MKIFCGYCKTETLNCKQSKQPTCDVCGLLRTTTAELKTCCPDCSHLSGDLRCYSCHASGSTCRNFGGEKCCEKPEPDTPEGWAHWALDCPSASDEKNVIEAIRRYGDQCRKETIEEIAGIFEDERCIDHEKEGLCVAARIRALRWV